MCVFFSCILKPGVDVRWCECNSHTVTLVRLGIMDTGIVSSRTFLRVEVHGGLMERYHLDERDGLELPAWYTEHENEYRERTKLILDKILPLYAEYKAEDTRHNDVLRDERNAAEKVIVPITAKYHQSTMSDWHYKRWSKAYQRITKEYEAKLDKLTEVHDAAIAQIDARLRMVVGYTRDGGGK
jgi:hypothetical protein